MPVYSKKGQEENSLNSGNLNVPGRTRISCLRSCFPWIRAGSAAGAGRSLPVRANADTCGPHRTRDNEIQYTRTAPAASRTCYETSAHRRSPALSRKNAHRRGSLISPPAISLFSRQKLPGTRLTPISLPASFPSFHLKSFPGRVSPRYRSLQAFSLFTSEASRGASHPDIAPGRLSLFSPQMLPETRPTPTSHPTSFPSFHLKSFQGRVPPRYRNQQAFSLFTSPQAKAEPAQRAGSKAFHILPDVLRNVLSSVLSDVLQEITRALLILVSGYLVTCSTF